MKILGVSISHVIIMVSVGSGVDEHEHMLYGDLQTPSVSCYASVIHTY